MVTDTAFAFRNPEAASSAGGPLQGLRIALQPNISVAGWPAESGSTALAGFKALEDCTIVQRLRGAGARLCGATRMSEFGFGLQGSGAGDALRTKEAAVELVMDFMGESRLAALRAAVCGFKPSYGLVSRYGLTSLIPSMECCGVLSGSLQHIRAVLQAVAGPDELDFSLPAEKLLDFTAHKMDAKKTAIGVIAEAQLSLSPEQSKQFRSSLNGLKKAGFVLRELSLPELDLFPLVHRIVGSVEASSACGRYDSVRYGPREPGAKNWNEMYLLTRGAAFAPLLKSYLFQGASFQFERYAAFEDACRVRARLVGEMQKLAAQADFLAFPLVDQAASQTPSTLSGIYVQFASTIFASVTGQPVLCLPPAAGDGHAGLQLAGPRLSDARLLDLGDCILSMGRGG